VNAISQFPARTSGPRLDNRRVAAGVVDLAVVGVVGAVLSLIAGSEFTPLLGAVTVGWGLFYYFVTESTSGQTLGKRWLGLRVERAAGGTPDEREIALRTILRVVDGIGFYLVGLAVMLRTGERRQRLGDIVAGTAVVDAREPSKPTVKSTLRTMDAPLASPEVPTGAEATDEQPHRAELPSSLFTHDRDEETDSAEPDEGPRVEIVSRDEDLTAEDAPEPELPVAEVEIVEPEPELPLPEPQLPVAEAEEPAAEEPEAELPLPEPDGPEDEEPEADEPELEPAADAEAEAESDTGSDEEKPEEATLPRVSSPALDELADDVASTTSKPRRRPRKEAEPEKAPADEPITVKPVKTVSPIDLVMDDAEDEPEKAGKGPRARARTRGGAS
jgi:uncharacterized RDD family membrane protein YckC